MKPALHTPVMVHEILEKFQAVGRPVNTYLDGTFGRGGHYRAVREQFPAIQAVCLDRDLAAIEFGEKEFAADIRHGLLRLVHGNFANFELKDQTFDLVLLDLGVSSPQLGEAQRGFSFYQDGPLDMRMDQTAPLKAEQVINEATERELTEIFERWGEIRRPQRVVRAVVHDRKQKPFTSTRQLASLIERVEGWRHKGQHPATQYFMALRIQVNEELNELSQALHRLCSALSAGGRICVLTFHSLEDRIVKRTFQALSTGDAPLGELVHKKVITAAPNELKNNPRARSAKLRTFQRGERQ